MAATTDTETAKPTVTTSDTEIATEPDGDENGHGVAEPLDGYSLLIA
ncbi:hypothetical protein ACIQK6_24025 [Streptomyces sp. NPDC091682]